MLLSASKIRLSAAWASLFLLEKLIVIFPALYLKDSHIKNKELRILGLLYGYILTCGIVALYRFGDPRSIIYTVEYPMYFLLYYLIKNSKTTKRSEVNIFFLFSSLVIFTSILLYPHLLWSKTGINRFQGFFPHPNQLAYFSTLLIVMSLILQHQKRTFVLAVASFSLILTQTLGAIISLAASAMSIYFKGRRPNVLTTILAILVSLIGITTALHLFQDRINESILSIQILSDRDFESGFGGAGSGSWRIAYWSALVKMFFDDTLVTIVMGFGPSSFSSNSELFAYIHHDPHNEYVRILLEYGILGLLAFIYTLFSIAKIHPAFAAILSIGSFFDNYLQMNLIMTIFIFALAYYGRNTKTAIENNTFR